MITKFSISGSIRWLVLRDDEHMPDPTAEISALATALAELTARVSALADKAAADTDSDMASELFAVERALTNANRRMTKIGRSKR